MDSVPGDLGEFLSVRKSKTPKFRTDAFYSHNKRVWATDMEVAKAIRLEKIADFRRAFLCCERAPSAISRCRICGAHITKDDPRVGYPIGDPRGNYGVITAWMHTTCGNAVAQEAYLASLEAVSNPPSPSTSDFETDEATKPPVKVPKAKPKPKAAKPKVVKETAKESSKRGRKSKIDTNVDKALDEVTQMSQSQPDGSQPTESQEAVASLPDATDADVSSFVSEEDPTLATWLEDLRPEARDFVRFLHLYCVGYGGFPKAVRRQIFSDLSQPVARGEEVSVDDFVKRVLTARHPPPTELTTRLLPFQEEGLAWMVEQEQSISRGGILADEMGMGKTVQTIAMILARRVHGSLHPDFDPSKALRDLGEDPLMDGYEDMKLPADLKPHELPVMEAGTLVVAPLAAVLQWQNEIERFTKPGALNVMIYHGAHRKLLMEEMAKVDVVITTYATIESDYRRIVNKHKIACEYCHQMFLPSKLRFHLMYICGPDAQRTERQALRERKATEAAEQAMKSMGIGEEQPNKPFVPTPANVMKEILLKAGRYDDAISMAPVPWISGRRAVPRSQSVSQEGGSSQTGGSSQVDGSSDKDGEEDVVEPPRRRRRFEEQPDHRASPPLSPVANGSRRSSLRRSNPSNQVPRKGGSRRNSAVMAEDSTSSDGMSKEETTTGGRETRCHTEGVEAEASSSPYRLSKSETQSLVAARLAEFDPYMLHKLSVAELKSLVEELFEVDMTRHKKIEIIQYIRKHGYGIEDDGRANKSTPSRSSLSSPASAMSRSEALSSGPSSAAGKRQTRQKRIPLSTEMDELSSSSEDDIIEDDSDEYIVSGVSESDEEVSVYEGPSDGSSPAPSEPPSSDSDLEIIKIQHSRSKKGTSSFEGKGAVSGKLSGKPYGKPAGKSSGKKGGKANPVVTSGPEGSSSDSSSDESELSDVLDIEMDLSASPLHNIRWHRIILDEAHRIKSRSTSTAKSIFALPSCGTRWCLTGTPLQNRVGELFSLLRFLRHDPYAYYFCSKRDCTCRSLNYNFRHDKYCSQCGHTKMQHFNYFNKRIAKPIVDYGYAGEGRHALMALKNEVLDQVVLRRTKLERAEDVKLPKLEILIRREKLTNEERDFYEALYKQSKVQFNTYVDSGTLLHNFAHIFDLLSRLRQACDHPYLIIHGSVKSVNAEGQDAVIPTKSRSDTDCCGICWEDIEHTQRVSSSCLHSFHRLCIREFMLSAPEGTTLGCPVCYSTLTVDLGAVSAFDDSSSRPSTAGDDESSVATSPPPSTQMGELERSVAQVARKQKGIMSKIKASEFQSSTKIECLVQELDLMYEASSTDKAIVFSQYTSMLELIEFRLNKQGMSCVKLTGSLPMEARHNILTAFNTEPALRVILISLKAGGEGLNLQIASRIFLMDPWWNPAAEMQAIQRAHRIGQTKPVRAIRFIADGTVEERILELQEKKQLVFDGTVGSSAQAFQKLSADDLRFLFH